MLLRLCLEAAIRPARLKCLMARWAAACVVAVLVGAGCSSGEDDDASQGTPIECAPGCSADSAGSCPCATPSPTPPPVYENTCEADLSRVLRLHYQNSAIESSYASLYMWAWNAFSPELDVQNCGRDGYGALFDVPRDAFTDLTSSDKYMGFKFKHNAGTNGPWYEFDRKWDPTKDAWEVWVIAGDTTLYTSPDAATLPHISSAWWDSPTEVTVTFSKAVEGIDKQASYALDHGASIQSISGSGTTFKLTTSALDVQTCYTLTVQVAEGSISNALYPRKVLDSYVTDEALGSGIDASGNTWFRVFAPRATDLQLYTAATPEGASTGQHAMTRDAKTGVWSYQLTGNQHGLYYWFTADGPSCRGEKFDRTKPLNDPYSAIALSSYGSDGQVRAGRSMVMDLAMLGEATHVPHVGMEGLVSYELHVRDLTGGADSGLDSSDPAFRKYEGFTIGGLEGPNVGEVHVGDGIICLPPDCFPVKTGLDHLVELGVNAVQLLPVEEFPYDPGLFNWGYFTANFFSPEGAFASKDTDETKALELKAAVDALHARGIAVVMDIVFNHTAEGTQEGPYINFKGFDSKYYYRQDPYTYAYDNGSGVGNEVATENAMVRKFLLDCMQFWVDHYGIDGFRFDLAGLIDLKTMGAIAQRFPDLYLYGEPWAASGALWSKGAVNAYDPWAVFNDSYRDAVKGGPENADAGWLAGTVPVDKLKSAITGSSVTYGAYKAWASEPGDSLNYLDAHDNLVLADKLEVSISGLSIDAKEARVKMAGAIALNSLGATMLHAGVDFLRSKPWIEGNTTGRAIKDVDSSAKFDANSYASPDETNNLEWQLKADHYQVFRYFQGLIALRRDESMGRATRVGGPVPDGYIEWITDPADGQALGWTLNFDKSNGNRRIRVLVNANAALSAAFDVDFAAADHWKQVADSSEVDLEGLADVTGLQSVTVEPLGVRIYVDGY